MKQVFTFLMLVFSVLYLSAQDQKSDTSKTNQNLIQINKTIYPFPYTDLQKLKMLNSSVVYYGNNYGINGILSDGDNYIIDGMRITDYNLFSISAIETYSFYNSYAPIEFGNSLAGFAQINTKSPSNKINFDITLNSGFTGSKSLELNERRLNFAFSSPFSFLKKIYGNQKLLPSVLIAGAFDFTKDPNPSHIGNTNINYKTYSFLSENPLQLNTSGTGTNINAEFVTNSNFETSSLRKNTDQNSFNPYIKFLIPISEKAKITLGSFINISDGRLDVYENTVFNSALNPAESKRNYSNYARFDHQLVDGENFKLNYQLQINYYNNSYELQSATNKDNFFNYGYIGKFTTHKEKSYEFGVDTITGLSGMLQNNNYDNGVDFIASDINPLLSNYTSQYYNFVPNSTYTQNISNIQLNGGLLNGNKPQSVYGMQNNIGTIYNLYYKNNTTILNPEAFIDIAYKKNHHFKIGFQYNQKSESFYAIKPVDLWYLARTETNKHIAELDFLNPVPIYDVNGIYQGIIDYNRLYDASSQSFFDFNLRKKLGLATDGTDWIDIDSYAPETFSMDMFSADELLNGGKSYVEYAGFDYTGKKLNTQPSLDDFFNQKDGYGNYSRNIGAFKPIYGSAYVQYTYTGKKINAQIGVRGDFYNANQMKLKDPYLLYEAKTAKTVTNLGLHPDNIGENYVVYVNDAHNPTSIVGYRDLGNWYNAAGTKIEDPALLETSNGIAPYLVNPHQNQINSSAFESYKTVLNLLPSFSINYDFLPRYQLFGSYQANTQNPNSYSQLRSDQYLFISNQDYILNNPALKPEKVVKAKIGVKRMFFSSFLAEVSFNYFNIENKVLLKYYYDAYPASYYTYANTNRNFVRNTLDFSIKYYKPGEKELNIGIYYSLLFKSKDSIHFTPFTKHIANSFINYQFNKKVIIDNQVIKRPVFGISLIHHFRSKTYYSDYLYEYELPIFQYFDLKIEKPFFFGKNLSASVFVVVQNIFNTKNIFSVYPNTNKVDDDGASSSPGWLSSDQSYKDLYLVNMNNPNFYDTPRMLIFGIRFGL